MVLSQQEGCGSLPKYPPGFQIYKKGADLRPYCPTSIHTDFDIACIFWNGLGRDFKGRKNGDLYFLIGQGGYPSKNASGRPQRSTEGIE